MATSQSTAAMIAGTRYGRSRTAVEPETAPRTGAAAPGTGVDVMAKSWVTPAGGDQPLRIQLDPYRRTRHGPARPHNRMSATTARMGGHDLQPGTRTDRILWVRLSRGAGQSA
jgi:hypothetical protein